MNFFTGSHDAPPSLADEPLFYMIAVIGLLSGTLICLHWFYSIVSEWVDEPYGRQHPITANRVLRLTMILAALSATLPRLILVMNWTRWPAETREAWALTSWLSYLPWAVLLAVAWYIDHMASPAIRWQLRRQPTPATTMPASAHPSTKTASIILLVIFVVAAATTYVRPYERVGRPAATQHR